MLKKVIDAPYLNKKAFLTYHRIIIIAIAIQYHAGIFLNRIDHNKRMSEVHSSYMVESIYIKRYKYTL